MEDLHACVGVLNAAVSSFSRVLTALVTDPGATGAGPFTIVLGTANVGAYRWRWSRIGYMGEKLCGMNHCTIAINYKKIL